MCSALSSVHGLKERGIFMCSAFSSAHEGPGNEIGGYVATILEVQLWSGRVFCS